MPKSVKKDRRPIFCKGIYIELCLVFRISPNPVFMYYAYVSSYFFDMNTGASAH